MEELQGERMGGTVEGKEKMLKRWRERELGREERRIRGERERDRGL